MPPWWARKTPLTCSIKPPKLPPQSTSNRLLTGRLPTFGADKKNFRFSLSPEPNEFLVKGTSLRSTILTGRSNRNCLRFDHKLFGIICAGAVKSGSAELGTGITSSGSVRFGLRISSGSRLIEPGTVFPSNQVDAGLLKSVPLAVMIRACWERLREPLG